MTEIRRIVVYIQKLTDSGFMVARSEDMRTLAVFGRTREELASKIPEVIQMTFSLAGRKVLGVQKDESALEEVYVARLAA